MTPSQQRVYDVMRKEHVGGVYSFGTLNIAERTGMKPGAVSQHVSAMIKSDVITQKFKGNRWKFSEYYISKGWVPKEKTPFIDELFNNNPMETVNPTAISSTKSKALLFMQEICQREDLITMLTEERNQYKAQFEESQRKIQKLKECLQ